MICSFSIIAQITKVELAVTDQVFTCTPYCAQSFLICVKCTNVNIAH